MPGDELTTRPPAPEFSGDDARDGTRDGDGTRPAAHDGDGDGDGDARADHSPGRLHRWRSIVLAPRGDGSVHRRGSDAFRIVAAVVIVLVCELIVRTDSHPETVVLHVLTPPPNGIRWLVAVVWYLGSLGVIALVVVVALVTRNHQAGRDIVLSGLVTWALCELSSLVLGATGGRPADPSLHGINLGFPLARIATAIAVMTAALPYLSRGLQRLVELAVFLAAVSTVVYGAGMPVSVLGSLALGWGITAVLHLSLGSPTGWLSGPEVGDLLAEMGLAVREMTPRVPQVWGAAHYRGRDRGPDRGQDGWIDATVYGRDAADAQMFGKIWRFLFYRDSGPTLSFTRLQQVEHEAYLTLLASRAGAAAPEVLAAGSAGPSRDAILATRPPTLAPTALSQLGPEAIRDSALDDLFRTIRSLRTARIAHGGLSTDTIVADPEHGTTGLVDFRLASSSAPQDRLDRDVAGALAACALAVGPERTIAAAGRGLDREALAAALPHLHPAALDHSQAKALRKRKPMMQALREQGAEQAGVEVPKLAEPRRVSWVNLVFAIGTVIGAWALIGVLADVGQSFDTIVGAAWGWVVATFVLAQLVYVGNATELVGSVTGIIPFGRGLALEVSNAFTSLAAGTMGTLAARVRFFQQQGYSATLAVSSGVLVSTASWIVKGALFLIALPLAAGSIDFERKGGSGGDANLVWLIVIVVVLVGLALGLVLAVPRLRRLARDKLRPRLSDVKRDLKALSKQPRKMAQIFGGCVASQVLVALALGTALHAFGQHLSLAALIVVLTLASMVGGVSPVPGGMGVVEAGMIFLLTSAGIPQDDAVAAVFVQRLFTAYLPPIWGWFVLAWMRRREYL